MPLQRVPYMQFVAKCRKPEAIPAVCHVDGTSRVQTLNAAQNASVHQLLNAFYQQTRCPLLLNTSLNIKGEPLVNSAEDARRFSELHGIEIF